MRKMMQPETNEAISDADWLTPFAFIGSVIDTVTENNRCS